MKHYEKWDSLEKRKMKHVNQIRCPYVKINLAYEIKIIFCHLFIHFYKIFDLNTLVRLIIIFSFWLIHIYLNRSKAVQNKATIEQLKTLNTKNNKGKLHHDLILLLTKPEKKY